MAEQKSFASPPATKAAICTYLAALWPQPCAGCLHYGPYGRAGLCALCSSQVVKNTGLRCDHCDGPQHGEASAVGRPRRCAACRRHPPAFAQLRTPYLLCGPLRLLIAAVQATHLGHAQAPARLLAAEPQVRLWLKEAVLVPMPRIAQGTESCASAGAMRLAQALGRLFRRPVATLLECRGAQGMACSAAHVSHDAQLVLVDDVAYDVASFDRAARALIAAGFAAPRAIAVARAPT